MPVEEELQQVIGRYGTAVKVYGAVIAILVLILAGSGGLAWHYRAKAAQLQDQAASLRATADMAEAKAKASDAVASLNKAEADKWHREVARLQGVVDSIPTPPPAAIPPTENLQLAKDLINFGFKTGVRVFALEPGKDQTSALASNDAVLAWSWHAEFVRAPVLDAKLQATQSVVEAQGKETESLRLTVGGLEASRDERIVALKAQAERGDKLDAEIKALHHEATVHKWTTGAEILGAAIVAYAVGRHH